MCAGAQMVAKHLRLKHRSYLNCLSCYNKGLHQEFALNAKGKLFYYILTVQKDLITLGRGQGDMTK